MDAQLYIVPTPIGNLKDITLRALDVLKEVDVILAEDTRQTIKLLKHYDISNSLQSFHLHNEHKVLNGIIGRLKAGETMAIVSDAGTPGISDPGFLLARECLKNDIKIDVLPGATAFVPALIQSGFPTERFIYEGFLPHKKGRQKRLEACLEEERTVVFYESPHRIEKAVTQIVDILGEDKKISISRELTKFYEETLTGTAKELLEKIKLKPLKGEIVLVIHGKD
jgi:16S rRNA (cytidine1402-2'-O)-methyltransferase